MPVSEKRFSMGRILGTPNVLRTVWIDEIRDALYRHSNGDWGDVSQADWRSNDYAVRHGERILSAYITKEGQKFWIITEADRSATTILLPEDY